jgi:hypothetical protein
VTGTAAAPSSPRARAAAVLFLALTSCAEGTGGAGSGSAATGSGGSAAAGGEAGAPGTGGAGAATSSTSSADATSTTGPGGQGGGDPGTTASQSASSSSGGGASPPGTLFFSEYVEGDGNDKALEVRNASGAPLALGGCVVERYQNGATSSATPIQLGAVELAPGAVHVLCNTDFSDTSRCDQLSPDLQHSGDDAVALVCGGATKDVFGRIGEDAVWGSPPTSSEDAVLRRKCDVVTGDTNGGDAFDPAVEWTGVPVGTFGDLGSSGCP